MTRLDASRLTDIQSRILQYIILRQRWGYTPSVREIGDAFRLRSPSTVHQHLKALEWKGYLRRAPGVSRGLQVLSSPVDTNVSCPTCNGTGKVRPATAVRVRENGGTP